MKSTIYPIALAVGLAIASFSTTFAATIGLSGNDHTGYLSYANVNNEATEPNGQNGAKNFDYPYYFDSNQGLYVVIAAEPLSTASVYAEESTFTVLNKDVTDVDFGSSNFGTITYDEGLLSGSGVETLSLGANAFDIDLTDFSPLGSPRNVNNEFAWDYVIETQSIGATVPELTFNNGVLTGINGQLNVGVAVRFFGNDFAKFQVEGGGAVATFDGTLTFAGDQFVFDIDETQNVQSFLGALSDTRLVFNRQGSIAAVVPEPSSAVLLIGAALGWSLQRRRRNSN